MSEWERVRLTEVLDFKEGPGILAKDFREQGVPLIRLAGVKAGAHILDGCNYLDPAKVASKWSHFTLDAGDALLSTSASLGEVAVVTHDGVGAVPYTGLIRFRPKVDRLSRRFIPIALTSRPFKLQIEAMGVGSVMKHFGPMHLRQMTLELPPHHVQEAISDVVEALDDKVEANRKLAATADDLSAALVRSSCDPGRVDRLGDVAEITMGSSPKGETMNEDGDGVPFYQGVRDFGLRFPARRVWTTAPIRRAAAGDILVSVRAPVGTLNYAPESLCIGRGLAAIRSRTGQQSTLFHLLRSVRRSWAEYDSGGTVFGSINRDQLHNIEFPAIRTDDAARCESEVQRVEQRLASALRENESLTVLRDTLLPKLMSGQLRVEEAMELVGS